MSLTSCLWREPDGCGRRLWLATIHCVSKRRLVAAVRKNFGVGRPEVLGCLRAGSWLEGAGFRRNLATGGLARTGTSSYALGAVPRRSRGLLLIGRLVLMPTLGGP